MSVDRETYHADIEQVREIAHRLLRFARATPPRPDFCVGYILGERLACLVEDQGEAADIAWLIEIMGDSIAVLAATLRDEHLAKSNAQ